MSIEATRLRAGAIAALACGSIAISLLAGCRPSSAQSGEAPRPPPRPTPEQLREATNSAYSTTPDARQECLGRLVFDVSGQMQWGVNAPGLWSGDRYRFTEKMHGGHDDLWVDNVQVLVMAPANRASIERMANSLAAKKENGIGEYQDSVNTIKDIAVDRTARLKDPSFVATAEERAGILQAIEDDKIRIADTERRIANIGRDWHPIDLGVPDSLGYAAGPDLYGFLLRNDRAYKFVMASGEGDPPFEVRQQAFLEMIKRFQVRQLYEVPNERGICVPYGFLPDDGSKGFRIAVSMRYADHPGVIYTLGTGVVGENGVDGSEPSLLKAIGRAGGAGIGGMLAGTRDIKRIGPSSVRIGALPANQGGISMNVADAGKPPVNGYSVYTGYGGWGHSRVLPFITVDMRSFTREQEPTLKSNPPPVDESMVRLDALLRSIRLRPTTQPMPELVNAGR